MFRAPTQRRTTVLYIVVRNPENLETEKALKSTFYTIELHTVILYIIFSPKHCRLFLSTKDFFVLIAKKTLKLSRDNRTCFLMTGHRAKMPYFCHVNWKLFKKRHMTVALNFDQL